MPIEVYDKEEFIKIAERAEECRVVVNEKKKVAKVKARTKRYLYTIKVKPEELDEFLKQLKCGKIYRITKKGKEEIRP